MMAPKVFGYFRVATEEQLTDGVRKAPIQATTEPVDPQVNASRPEGTDEEA